MADKGTTTADDACVHHFVIVPPRKNRSKGKCVKCGKEEMFSNNKSRSRSQFALDEQRAYDKGAGT